jgi:hypothetical protein
MSDAKTILARLLAGVPVPVPDLDALPDPARSIAWRVANASGNGALEAFDLGLAELPEDERAAFKAAVFSADPLTEPGPEPAGLVSEGVKVYGAQFKTLADAMAPHQKLPSVVEGVLPSRSLTVWYGSPGNLKSNLLLDLCFSVATGFYWLPDLPSRGAGLGLTVNQCPALWLDIDNGEDVVTERLAAFANARHAPNDAPIHWLTFPNPPMVAVKGLPGLTDYALSIKAGVIVIDNLLRVAGVRDENASEIDGAMVNLRRLAEDTGAAVCLIHHKRKDSLGREGDSLRGHSSIEGGVDSAFLIKREDNQDTITVKCTKARRKPVETFGALWTYTLAEDGETLQEARFWRADPKDHEAESKAELRQCVLSALSNGPLNQSHLADAVGAAKSKVIETANALIAEGKIMTDKGDRNATIYRLG